ncbi:MAG: PEP-CTERM sorting domain-containing protein [Planctomycetia bacterium]|jgi:hypothetical protein
MLLPRPATRFLWLIVFACFAAMLFPSLSQAGAMSWYKGNTHCHTTWSDGNSSPAFVTEWYKNHDYNFLVLSDHNKLYMSQLETLGNTYNEAGEFLLVPGEEITTSWSGEAVHMNGLNLAALISPVGGTSVATTLNANLAQVAAQSAAYDQPMISHINHPNWDNYSISPENIAQASDTRFFEVLNCHSASINHYGNSTHPGMEKVWDIVNTIRMVNMDMLPMYGLATDDAHNYTSFGPTTANPGRGWVMVQSEELSANALMNAMIDGDYYCSTGIDLATLSFDTTTGELSVQINPESGVNYTIDFIGTPKGTDPTKQGDGSYSDDIGKLLVSVPGVSASYALTGDELYVRAHIRSDKMMSNPASGSVQYEEAWTQPVGEWMVTTVPEPSSLILLGSIAAAIAVWFSRRR